MILRFHATCFSYEMSEGFRIASVLDGLACVCIFVSAFYFNHSKTASKNELAAISLCSYFNSEVICIFIKICLLIENF